jgi:hypothetical protein
LYSDSPSRRQIILSNVLQIVEHSVPVSPAMQPIPDSVPEDVKCLLKKCPSILRMGEVMSTPTHGVEHHIHTGSHPPVFAKSHRLDPENLEIAKAEFKPFGIRRHCSPFKINKGLSFAHGAQKRWILATLWRLLPSQFGDNP